MSYYDTRKNQYITVPSVKNKYFTDSDTIEAFDDTQESGTPAPNTGTGQTSTGTGTGTPPTPTTTPNGTHSPDSNQFIHYDNTNPAKFVIDPNEKLGGIDENKIGDNNKNMEGFVDIPGGSQSLDGSLSNQGLGTNYCHEGNNLYTSKPYTGIGGDGFQECSTKCQGDFKDSCVGVVEQQDFPNAGKVTCYAKSQMDGSSQGIQNDKCTSHYMRVSDTPDVVDPLTANINKNPASLNNILNPPLPGPGASLDSVATQVWSGEGQPVTQASNYNQKVRKENCTWNWDASCIPKDIDYYSNTQMPQNKEVLGLPTTCKGSQLNPYNPAIIQDSGNNYIYVDGRKMLLGKNAMSEGCYAAKYWMDPSTREKCVASGGGGTCPNQLSGSGIQTINNLPPGCVDDIPTIPGNNTEENNSVECRSDLRPSQRVMISNALSKEANEWSNIGRKATLLYNTKSAIAASKYGEISKANTLLRKQVDNSQSNEMKLNKLDNSIYSQQRQVQIANDETRRRNENLFLLKLLLTYILIICIPMIIKKGAGDSFKNSHVLLIFIFITIPFLYVLANNIWSIRNRSPMRWPLRNWPTGPLPDDNDVYEEEQAPTCPPPAHKVAQCQEEADALEEEIDNIERKKKRLKRRESKLDATENKLEKKVAPDG